MRLELRSCMAGVSVKEYRWKTYSLSGHFVRVFFFVRLNTRPSLLRAHRELCCLRKCAFLTIKSWISLSSHCVVQNQSAPVPFCCKAELLRCIIWKLHRLPPSDRWRSEWTRLHMKADNFWYFTLASSIDPQWVVGMIQIKAVNQKVCHHTLDSVLELLGLLLCVGR